MLKSELISVVKSLKIKNEDLLRDKIKKDRELRHANDTIKSLLDEVGELHEEVELKDFKIDVLTLTLELMSAFLSDEVTESILKKVELEMRLKDE